MPEREALLRAIEAQKRVMLAAIRIGEDARMAREKREREAIIAASLPTVPLLPPTQG